MATPRPTTAPPLGKLSLPRLGRVIGRERLFDEVDQKASAPGLWVTGPPGIGKTTLVASYLEARALPCLWLQLDAGDADPASFVHFLRAAVLQQAPRRAAFARRRPSKTNVRGGFEPEGHRGTASCPTPLRRAPQWRASK